MIKQESFMLITMSGKLSKMLFLPSIVAVFCLSLVLASAVQAQPRPGQNQVNPAAGATDRAKDEPISGWYIALIAGLAILILVLVIVLVIFFRFIGLFVQCWLTGAQISILDLLWMKLRNVDYGMIVRQKIALVQANTRISTQELEAHYLSRGNVPKTAAAV